MKSFFRKLQDRGAAYEPLISVRILKKNLLHNVAVFAKKVAPLQLAPVLKSNAYGHGLLEVAQILEGNENVAFVVVDSYYEVRVLRTEGLNMPLLVLGYTLSENILNNPFADVAFSVGSIEQLEELATRATSKISVHIKIDTGMHRQGVRPNELLYATEMCMKNPNVCVEGLCSHLADADGPDPTYTKEQIAVWNACAQQWGEKVPNTKFYHLAATKGVQYGKDIDANVSRLGIGLYGIDPLGEMKELRPVLEMQTRVTAVHDVLSGESVGYNCTWKAIRLTRVATIPVGYFEGVDRRLSNKGFIEVEGSMCPIIGRVSMNMTIVDVTDVPNVSVDSDVIVISSDSTKQNSTTHMANLCETIPYEILVHVSPYLRRTVI